jgi:hypothetical protein
MWAPTRAPVRYSASLSGLTSVPNWWKTLVGIRYYERQRWRDTIWSKHGKGVAAQGVVLWTDCWRTTEKVDRSTFNPTGHALGVPMQNILTLSRHLDTGFGLWDSEHVVLGLGLWNWKLGLQKLGIPIWRSGSPVCWNGYLEVRFFQMDTWGEKMDTRKVGPRRKTFRLEPFITSRPENPKNRTALFSHLAKNMWCSI